MKKLILCLVTIFAFSSFAGVGKPCSYNAAKEIDWKLQCGVSAATKLQGSCKKWPLFISMSAADRICFDDGVDIKTAELECKQLAVDYIGENIDMDLCESVPTRTITKSSWELNSLVDIRLNKDGTQQGVYKKLSSGKIR